MDKIGNLRKNYTKGRLLEKDLPKNPNELFQQWFNEITYQDYGTWHRVRKWIGKTFVGESLETNAMTLSTVGLDGTVNSRTVLLKGFGENYFEFFTNYTSNKTREIENNPSVSLVFWWAPLQRQVIIRGEAEKVDILRSIEYFNSRPRESKLGAHASEQSRELLSREELEIKYNRIKRKYKGTSTKDIQKPPEWGGYRVVPKSIEFWQGRVGRLHDRIRYDKENTGEWIWMRLSP